MYDSAKTTGNAVGKAAEATGEAVGNAAEATDEYLTQKKDEAVKAAQEKIDLLDKEMAECRTRRTTTDEAKADFQKAKDSDGQDPRRGQNEARRGKGCRRQRLAEEC